jgi:hypothetical protein
MPWRFLMDALEVAALIAVAVWLGTLTLTNLLTLRQTGILTAWMQQRTLPVDEGLDAGAPIPEAARQQIPELTEGLGYVVFLGANCIPCRDFALDMGRSKEIAEIHKGAVVVAAVAGRGAQAEEVARMLPDWAQIVRSPHAEALQDAFLVHATPTVYEVELGNVTGHAVAGQGIVNFEALIQARQNGSNASRYAGSPNGAPEIIHINSNEGAN